MTKSQSLPLIAFSKLNMFLFIELVTELKATFSPYQVPWVNYVLHQKLSPDKSMSLVTKKHDWKLPFKYPQSKLKFNE